MKNFVKFVYAVIIAIVVMILLGLFLALLAWSKGLLFLMCIFAVIVYWVYDYLKEQG